MKIVIGIIMMAVGVAIVIKTESVLKAFGRIDFFEKHFGTEGGSRLGYNLIGLAMIFLGVMMVFGMIGGFMNWVLSPIFNAGPS